MHIVLSSDFSKPQVPRTKYLKSLNLLKKLSSRIAACKKAIKDIQHSKLPQEKKDERVAAMTEQLEKLNVERTIAFLKHSDNVAD